MQATIANKKNERAALCRRYDVVRLVSPALRPEVLQRRTLDP